ncbi:hypothetical protein SAMN02744775_03526 [Enterobacter sp. CC120223-11]|nr:hypothetical protein SAMN02744775_03526 [Enterobacter sp. CC120223-11]
MQTPAGLFILSRILFQSLPVRLKINKKGVRFID